MNEELMKNLEEEARKSPQIVIFPESGNEMILKAAREVLDRKIGKVLLVGNEEAVKAKAAEVGVQTEGFLYFDNTNEEIRKQLAAEYLEKFDDFSEKAILRKTKDAVSAAMFLAKLKKGDCVAAGREYTTADVILAGQSIGGLKEGFQSVSSLGILNVPGFDGPEGNMLAIGDCAVIAAPDANDLADIAIASADTVKSLLKWEPRVAMLAFSTCGSTEHESLEPIREAIQIVRKRRPEIKIDGEFQLDTAIKPEVAAKKVPGSSEVAGRANVLIFPNLHAGNIGVKLIQIFGQADAYGPVLQGFALPICDFSRSAPLSEMMGNIIMLIIRAAAEKCAK